ncbi:VOC family protein [Bacillus salipaludis]|uniref:VOC family protein n=1 Tax=Bacillus salipaludis TaxID=2547811 RepID=A0A4R5VU12_9BACI|nr:VOC family protein [Bacillus salipaludis]MDQ6600137.1 VOC family protein [Bacillus salipaludis]TDK62399.1 VOC family protein [Bacillus salipaludis]
MPGKKIDHVGIMVKDIDASIKFYQEIVGMELKDKFIHSDESMTLAFLGFNGSDETELELIQGYNDNLPQEGKVHHFAVLVDDIEAEFNLIKGLDVKLIDEEITTLPNGYRYFFFHGHDGEWVEFFQR